MSPGPLAPHAFPGRGVVAAVCASLVLTWLVAATHYAPPPPPPRATAAWSVPPVFVWFPLIAPPLLWQFLLRC